MKIKSKINELLSETSRLKVGFKWDPTNNSKKHCKKEKGKMIHVLSIYGIIFHQYSTLAVRMFREGKML